MTVRNHGITRDDVYSIVQRFEKRDAKDASMTIEDFVRRELVDKHGVVKGKKVQVADEEFDLIERIIDDLGSYPCPPKQPKP